MRDGRGYTPTVAGPYAYSAVPSGIPPETPILLDSLLYVGRYGDELIPWEVLKLGFTKIGEIDQSTYVAGSPPTNWSENFTGSGALAVDGTPQYIHLSAPNGDVADLDFTIPTTVSANDILFVLFRGYAVALTGAANYCYVGFFDSASYMRWAPDHGTLTSSAFLGSANESPRPTQVSAVTTIGLTFCDPAGTLDASRAVEITGYRRWKTTNAAWIASVSTPTIQFRVYSAAGGSGTGHLYIDHAEIWQGSL